MKRLSLLVFFICSFTIESLQINIVNAADLLDVSINNSSKLIKKFALIDTVSSTPRVIEVDADSGSIIWEWKIPSDYIRTHNKRRPICAGAGLT